MIVVKKNKLFTAEGFNKKNMNMKHNTRNLLILIVAALLIVSCKKDSIPSTYTPPPTPSGTDTTTYTQYGTPFSGVPNPQDAIIYQVNIRAFSSGGNFQGVIARLDSIKALGVNVIYLMPIYPIGVLNSINSPYCIKDFLSVNTEFGTLTDLHTLIDGAHSRNMSVMLDWVANQTSWDNPWITEHKNWYVQNGAGNIISPPAYTDVAQLDYTNAAMRLQMISDMKYWVYTANIDGFRCDYADNIPSDFWTQAIDTLRNITTHKLLLLAEGSRSANYTSGFDYNFGFNYYGNLKNIFASNTSVQSIDALNNSDYTGATGTQQIARYITNHDVNGSDGTPVQLYGGQQGAMAAFVVTALMKGVPFIYDGQEVGMTTPITFPFTTVKINWALNAGITAQYKNIIAFRNNNQAIRSGQLTSYSSTDVSVFTKQQTGDSVLVISNLRNNNINYTVPAALTNTTWKDAVNGGTITLTTQLALTPYSYFLLKK